MRLTKKELQELRDIIAYAENEAYWKSTEDEEFGDKNMEKLCQKWMEKIAKEEQR